MLSLLVAIYSPLLGRCQVYGTNYQLSTCLATLKPVIPLLMFMTLLVAGLQTKLDLHSNLTSYDCNS